MWCFRLLFTSGATFLKLLALLRRTLQSVAFRVERAETWGVGDPEESLSSCWSAAMRAPLFNEDDKTLNGGPLAPLLEKRKSKKALPQHPETFREEGVAFEPER